MYYLYKTYNVANPTGNCVYTICDSEKQLLYMCLNGASTVDLPDGSWKKVEDEVTLEYFIEKMNQQQDVYDTKYVKVLDSDGLFLELI